MDKKPDIVGAPPTEPTKPMTSNGRKPSFSYRDLDLMEVLFIEGYRYLSFIVGGEFIVLIREFDYFSYLSDIFQQIEIIQSEGGGCVCDICEPNFTIIEENHKISAQKFDILQDKVVEESDKFIPIYECYDLNSFITVGICDINNEKK